MEYLRRNALSRKLKTEEENLSTYLCSMDEFDVQSTHARASCKGLPRVKSWSSPKFPLSYGTRFGVYVRGRSLPDSDVADNCIATFRGPGLIATLNECHGRFRLIYLGSGPFKIRWRVFA